MPTALAGLGTLARHRWAPRAGLAVTLLTLAAMLFPILDSRILSFGGFFSDAENRVAVLSILVSYWKVRGYA